jgi:hypothetical protein
LSTSDLGCLLRSNTADALQYIIKIKENKYFFFGSSLIMFYSVLSRLPGLLSIEGVLASDPWTIMGLANYIKYLHYIPEEFIAYGCVGYFALLGLMFTCNLEQLFITKFFQPIIIQPLITITVLLFLKKLRVNDRYIFLGTLFFILAPQLKREGQIYHPRNLGYLLAFALLYILTFYKKYRYGNVLTGILIGGLWLYHPPTAIPITFLLLICFLIKLINGIRKHHMDELKDLVEIFLVTFIVVSPMFVRLIMLHVTASRSYIYTYLQPNVPVVESEISAGLFSVIENTFQIMEFYTGGGLITFTYAFLALLLNMKLKKYNVNYISLYLLVLLIFGLNPYTRYIPSLSDRYRVFIPFAFPEAILVSVFMQYLQEFRIKFKVKYETIDKTVELDFSGILRYLCILLLLSVIISSTLLSKILEYESKVDERRTERSTKMHR